MDDGSSDFERGSKIKIKALQILKVEKKSSKIFKGKGNFN